MEIILLKDMDKVGYKHDVVTVKNGFGRNFLIPQGVAVIANATNRQKLEVLKEEEAKKELARLDEYKEMASHLNGKSIKIGVKSGTSGKIFGSVTNVQVAAAIQEQLELEIARKKIILPEEVKELGTYNVQIALHPEVSASIDIELIKE